MMDDANVDLDYFKALVE